MTLITEEYRALNASLHVTNLNYGVSGHKWAEVIDKCITATGANSVLDYGCGKETLAETLPYPITGYDPCLEGLDDPPIAHDFVVCSDVLEHIEPECIDAVLDDLKRLAIKGVFLLVATMPAKKTLADGRNAHILQRPPEWWLPKIMERWTLEKFQTVKVQKDGAKIDGEFYVFAVAK